MDVGTVRNKAGKMLRLFNSTTGCIHIDGLHIDALEEGCRAEGTAGLFSFTTSDKYIGGGHMYLSITHGQRWKLLPS
jgi:hypothetical protein